MIRRPPRSTPLYSSAASDVYKRQLRDQLLLALLEVAIASALAHSAYGAHGPVDHVAAPLPEDAFTRALCGSCQEGADHHAIGTGCYGLGDVSRIAYASVCNDRNIVLLRGASAIGYRRHLWNPTSRYHASSADGTRADAHLDSIHPSFDQRQGTFGGAYVAGYQLDVRIIFPDPCDGIQNTLGMAVSGVNADDVRLSLYQRGHPIIRI